MYRQYPARFHRSKGIKVKHVLQICLLLAVFIWLIYQVKHSHDKKKEYDESDENVLHQRTSSDQLLKLGRKDIRARVDGTISRNEDGDKQEEEEETAEVKHEESKTEDEPEYKVEHKEDEEYKEELKEDEGTGGGDEDTDENEHEKSDADVDREGESVDEEEREDSTENETRETDSEHAHGRVDKEVSSGDADQDGDNRSVNEAREEHYKADDASSAVTHDIQTSESGNENDDVKDSIENPENNSKGGNEENNDETDNGDSRKYLEMEGDRMGGDNQQFNVTASETMEDTVNRTENGSSSNHTVTEGFNEHLASNNSTEVTIENHDMPSQNATKNEPKLDHGQGSLSEATSAEESHLQTIDIKGDNTSVINVNGSHFDSNPTGFKEPKDAESHVEEFHNSSNNNTDSSSSENIIKSETSVDAGNSTKSASEKNDEIKAGKSDTNVEANETLDLTMPENPQDIQRDAIDKSDTSDSLEEKNVGVDLDTLPEIQSEGINNEDVAAE